jgi:hypothetical protein
MLFGPVGKDVLEVELFIEDTLEVELITEDTLELGTESTHLETLYEYGEGDIPEHVMPPSPSLTHIAAPTGCPELSTPQ